MSANEQAFPGIKIVNEYKLGYPTGQTKEESFPGLTKREYFAAKAMAGMLSNRSMYDSLPLNVIKLLSTDAFLIADEMVKASKVQS